jgi:hypothetical protein
MRMGNPRMRRMMRQDGMQDTRMHRDDADDGGLVISGLAFGVAARPVGRMVENLACCTAARPFGLLGLVLLPGAPTRLAE